MNFDQDNLKYLLALPQGRKLIWELLAFTGLYRQPAVFGNVEQTFFNAGGLNSGLALYADCMSASPELTAMMIKEQGNYDNGTSKPIDRDASAGDEDERTAGASTGSARGPAFDRFGFGTDLGS